MDYLYTLIAGLVIGGGIMYAIVHNNIKKVGHEKELLEEKIQELREKLGI